ncbi:hypothetical protein DE146DRAFT_616169, partial [Phaeosphaeria sp. MPI-PUGE-AT-0046c]
LSSRNITLLSMFSLGGGYLMTKSRTLAEKQRAAGDYSVTVDRSGAPCSAPVLSLHDECRVG